MLCLCIVTIERLRNIVIEEEVLLESFMYPFGSFTIDIVIGILHELGLNK